jgi:hypothetical protein
MKEKRNFKPVISTPLVPQLLPDGAFLFHIR